MARAVKISESLVQKAYVRAKVMHRSTAGQIEYWAMIGQIAEDNPDLSYGFIRNILISFEELKTGKVTDYVFGEGS